jgi:cytochrome c oxidase subunit 3
VKSAIENATARERDLNALYVLTVLVVLAIVTMTFGALIFAFIYRSNVSLNWSHIVLPRTLWVTSGILLASSITYEIGRSHLIRNAPQTFFRYTGVTAGLTVLFLLGQLVAWIQILSTGVLLDRNPHPSFIFIFSGLHGTHILVGLAGFIWLLRRTREPASGPKYQMTTRVIANAVGIFWHYLDFLWLVLFTLLLTWRR